VKALAVFFLLSILSSTSWSNDTMCDGELDINEQNRCLIGSSISKGDGSASKDTLVCQILGLGSAQEKNKTYWSTFLDFYKGDDDKGLLCGSHSSSSTLIASLQPQISSIGNKISKQCIEAALKRSKGQNNPQRVTCAGDYDGYTSHSYSSKSKTAYGKSEICFNEPVVDYIQYGVNSSMQCVNAIGKSIGGFSGIDPKIILRKLNRESAFNPTFYSATRGAQGTGMFQLTQGSIGEMKSGRGKYYMDKAKELSGPGGACEAFAGLLDRMPKVETRIGRKRACQFNSMGEGMARNLLFGMTYFAFLRDGNNSGSVRARLESKIGLISRGSSQYISFLKDNIDKKYLDNYFNARPEIKEIFDKDATYDKYANQIKALWGAGLTKVEMDRRISENPELSNFLKTEPEFKNLMNRGWYPDKPGAFLNILKEKKIKLGVDLNSDASFNSYMNITTPEIQERLDNAEEIVNEASLIAFGPKGMSGLANILSTRNSNKILDKLKKIGPEKLTVEDFKELARKDSVNSAYLKGLDRSMCELLDRYERKPANKYPPNCSKSFSQEELEGDLCIE